MNLKSIDWISIHLTASELKKIFLKESPYLHIWVSHRIYVEDYFNRFLICHMFTANKRSFIALRNADIQMLELLNWSTGMANSFGYLFHNNNQIFHTFFFDTKNYSKLIEGVAWNEMFGMARIIYPQICFSWIEVDLSILAEIFYTVLLFVVVIFFVCVCVCFFCNH